jgi:DNA-binding SARP family transcriptional activator/Tfp pilus assembly protein PilF/DNA-binding XRE family transcriptional regulator
MDRGVRDTGLLGTLLRGFRQAAGLTQHELARRGGLSLGAIRDLEQGRTRRPFPGSITALATALGLNPAQAGELERAALARGLWLQVLGPLAAWRDGAAVPLGGPAQRAVLGLLALSPGCLVHRSAIIDVLWPDSPPANAANRVQAHVSRLRHVLASGHLDEGEVLCSADASYRLQAGPGQLDLLKFGQLTAHARAAHPKGDYEVACSLYQQALGLLRGDPLADVDLLRGHPAVAGLARQRAETVVEYARVASGAGGHDRVLPLLRDLAGREPLNEQAHAQLMIALAGCGQQAEALAVYHDLRRQLDDELGMPPGPDLAEAHQLVLRQDIPAPAALATVAPGAAAQRTATRLEVPQQLPAAPPFFTGRAGELAALAQMLDQAGGTTPQTAVISAIGGTAGAGKTALAIYWAHQMAQRYPGGQLYADLRGFDPGGMPATSAEAIRGFLDALGVAASRIPPGLDAQASLYRSLAAGRQMLIVLDNARDEQQVRPLLPGTPDCLVVVTSRRQLAGLAASNGARLITLDVLTAAEARQLLTARLGTGRAAAEPDTVTEIADLCAFLPLALAVAAARAAARPHRSLATLAAELRTTTGRLDALDTGDPAASVRAVFSWSYQQLSPQAARLFRLLGLHPGPDITVAAAASMAGIPPRQAGQALDELTEAHLFAEHFPGRYAFHDLLRAYAAEQAASHHSPAQRRAATRRVLDHYLHTAYAADRLVRPSRAPLALPAPQPGTLPEKPADPDQAMAWLGAEHKVLMGVITHAAASGHSRHAWQLAWSVATFLNVRAYWDDLTGTQRTALAAATSLKDARAQALAHERLGFACLLRGHHHDAAEHFRQALALFQELGDQAGQAVVHLDVSLLLERQGSHAAAVHEDQCALSLSRAAGDRAGQARALNAAGWHQALLGQHQEGLTCCQQALALQRQLGDRLDEAATWDSIGYIHDRLGQHEQATGCYQQALRLLAPHNERHRQAIILTHLGDTHHNAGNPKAARDAWFQALAIFDSMRHPDAEGVRAKLQTHDY